MLAYDMVDGVNIFVTYIYDSTVPMYTVSHFSYAPLIKCKITRKINVIYLF